MTEIAGREGGGGTCTSGNLLLTGIHFVGAGGKVFLRGLERWGMEQSLLSAGPLPSAGGRGLGCVRPSKVQVK